MFFWFWFCDTALCMKRMNVSVHEEVRNIRVNGDAESKLTLSFGDIKGKKTSIKPVTPNKEAPKSISPHLT